LTLLALLVAMAAATPAFASTSPVVADCNAHGQLTQHYSVTELRNALANIPADVQEYTNCYAVINQALLSEVSTPRHDTTTSTQSSSSSFLPTPVIVVIVVLAVAGLALGGFALRRRRISDT
jgi:hypothetical protein